MKLSGLAKYLNDLNVDSEYKINTDSTKGEEVAGFDQLSIQWTENGIEKLIQLYPETTNMKIKRWKIWICASLDLNSERLIWKDTLYSNKNKLDLISAAPGIIDLGIKRLKSISKEDLKNKN